MQISLPRGKSNIYSFYVMKGVKSKTKILRVIIIIILVTILPLVLLSNSNYKNDCYKNKSYYMLSMCYTENKYNVEKLQLLVEELGGAGYAYHKNKKYYIIARAYLNREDAVNVYNKNIGEFKDAQIIEMSSKKIKKTIKRKIQANQNLELAFKYIGSIVKEVYNLSVKYDSNKISDREVYKNLALIESNLNDHINYVKKIESKDRKMSLICQQIKDTLILCKEDISFSLNELYRQDPIDISLKLLGVKLTINEINVKNAINNI